jgi:hypothetical protein
MEGPGAVSARAYFVSGEGCGGVRVGREAPGARGPMRAPLAAEPRLSRQGMSSPPRQDVTALCRVMCDIGTPGDVRHRPGLVTLSRRLRGASWTQGGRDWHWLSCRLSSKGWTRSAPCCRARRSPRSPRNWHLAGIR